MPGQRDSILTQCPDCDYEQMTDERSLKVKCRKCDAVYGVVRGGLIEAQRGGARHGVRSDRNRR